MSDPRNTERLEQIDDDILQDNPEYSDPDSMHYDPAWHAHLVRKRFEREADPDWPTDED